MKLVASPFARESIASKRLPGHDKENDESRFTMELSLQNPIKDHREVSCEMWNYCKFRLSGIRDIVTAAGSEKLA